jgi:Spy/CpxP family protein refolding chaperone
MAPRNHGPQDPRADEIAELEGQLERDREVLRQLISTPRWDSAELAADPRVREIAERMPRLQAELAALRTEAGR